MKRRRSFYVIAILLGLLPIIALEVGLRVLGIGDDLVETEVHAGFGNTSPLFQRDESDHVYRTSLTKEQFFVSQSFPDKKTAEQFRVFCLGGSTVQGRPYRPETSFGEWLEVELNATDASRTYDVINCGGISYASYRLQPVLQEVLAYEPDLVILATGHNEFLEDRTYASVKARSGVRIRLEEFANSLRTVMLLRKLTGGAPRVEPTNDAEPAPEAVETRLDDDAGYASYHRDSDWHEQVCEQYEVSVTSMVQKCQEAGVPLVLVRLGANLRDCPPFKSEHREGLSVEDEQQWQALFDEATYVVEKHPEKALTLYQRAAELDDQYPLLHFRIGRCLDRLQKFDEAKDSYQAALDLDICPLRMCSEIQQRLSAIAASLSVPVVDAEAAVAELSPQGITGYDAYIDHVHPTIKAHQKIAAAISEELQQSGMIDGAQLSAAQRREVYRQHAEQLGSGYYSNGRRRIGWLEGWARRQRLYDETLPVDTRGYVAMSIRNLDLHKYDEAADNLLAALHQNAEAAGLFVREAVSIFEQGRNEESKWILDKLREQPLAKSTSRSVDLGLLVLAFDVDHQADAAELYELHTDWKQIVEQDETGWAATMPDLNDRLAGFSAGTAP